VGQMLPYLHFTRGDNLWFLGWVPSSVGATVGACIGLFLLAVIERWVAACRSLMEAHWRNRTQLVYTAKLKASHRSSTVLRDSQESLSESKTSKDEDELPMATTVLEGSKQPRRASKIAPFVASQDITRGIIHAGQAALAYSFMLAVMYVLLFSSIMSKSPLIVSFDDQDISSVIHLVHLYRFGCWRGVVRSL